MAGRHPPASASPSLRWKKCHRRPPRDTSSSSCCGDSIALRAKPGRLATQPNNRGASSSLPSCMRRSSANQRVRFGAGASGSMAMNSRKMPGAIRVTRLCVPIKGCLPPAGSFTPNLCKAYACAWSRDCAAKAMWSIFKTAPVGLRQKSAGLRMPQGTAWRSWVVVLAGGLLPASPPVSGIRPSGSIGARLRRRSPAQKFAANSDSDSQCHWLSCGLRPLSGSTQPIPPSGIVNEPHHDAIRTACIQNEVV